MIVQAFFDPAGILKEYLLLGSLITSNHPFSFDTRILNSVIENASQGIAFADLDGKIIGANHTFYDTLGYYARDIVGHFINIILSSVHSANYFENISTAIRQHGSWQGECWLQHKDQHVFPAEVRAIAISQLNDKISCYAIYISDKSELKLVENNLRHLALHDPLTNLPNRTLLHERLFHSVRMAQKSNELFAVLHLDLDGFKVINNTFGHSLGDILLQNVSERLSESVHKDDLLARMGGDEFAIISYPSVNEGMLPASVTAQKIIDALTKPYIINDQELFVTASIGISLYPGDGENAITLLKNADIAMYRAKELGKNNFQFYSEELNRRVLKRLDMENHLRHALARNEFNLLYQPIIESHTRRITGMEALLRWEHTTLGRIMPDDFIPLAEETGLIVEIGKWVIKTACRQQVVLEKSGYAPIVMAVNISGRQLEDDEFVGFIHETLHETGIQPSRLVLEITESLLMEDIDTISKKLKDLRELGVKISIDDFGTGYSSLHSLVNLPIDSLKIDKSFVSALEENPHGLSLVKGVISIGHNLDMEIIAEGVEKNSQASLLELHGCDLLQGYYFGCPMSVADICCLMDPLLK
jgi:diguanylate cyclase (GGDEF)-like protein/PAS domain S-box-containing protein